MAMPTVTAVLRDRRLATLLAGNLISNVGDGILIVALPLEALRVAGTIPRAIAVALALTAPYVLSTAVSMSSGSIGLRLGPRQVIVMDSAVQMVGLAGLGVLAMGHTLQLWELVAVLLVAKSLTYLASASRRIMLADLADDSAKLALSSAIAASQSIAIFAAGPLLGGLLVALASPGAGLLADGASFIVELTAVALLCPRVSPRPASPDRPGGRNGWKAIMKSPSIRVLFVMTFLFNLLYGPVDVAVPLLVRGPLHGSGVGLGIVWMAFGLGSLASSVLSPRLGGVAPRRVLAAVVIGAGMMIAAVGASPTLALAALALGAAGLIYGPFDPVTYTWLQTSSDPASRQSMLAIWSAVISISAPIGILAGGPLTAAVSSRAVLIAVGVLSVALSVFVIFGLHEQPAGAKAV